MYASGTKVSETLAIRVEDLNLVNRELSVRAGKGAKDRIVPIGGSLAWQFLFLSRKVSQDSKTGCRGRRPLHPTTIQRALKKAVKTAGIAKPLCPHILRACFATEIIRSGCDVATLQRLMGHRDLQTTARYLHVIERPGLNIESPLDRLPSQRK
jgi:site-specific recombinase XerD